MSAPVLALAIGDDFIISQQIGNETTPPTVPSGVTTTPVATTQIDISWGTSTDTGSGLSGYQLFRDNVQIATTSATTYSDTGLTASTTYSYNVTAYDLFFNISARSATSSTTTLPVVATSTPTTTSSSGGNGGTSLSPIPLEILGVQTEVTDTTAVILFDTPGFAIASVRYGRTPQHELGGLANERYEKNHSFTVTDLEPYTKYFFEILVSNQRGDVLTYTGSFETQSLTDTAPPANVSNFRAIIENDDVVLEWLNPDELDFDRVRVIANDSFYPVDIADGKIIYDGAGEGARHENVHPEHSMMYYTIFALDEEGNQSSGAIASVRWPGATAIPSPDSPDVPSDEVPELSFENLEFIQNGRVRQGYQERVDIDPHRPFTIRLPYRAVPEHLKTITVALSDPTDETLVFAFLLRVNEEKSYYEATIGPLERAAEFPLRFSLFDLKTKTISEFTGTISTVPKTDQTYADPKRTIFEQFLFMLTSCWWCWILIIVLLYIAYRLLTEEPHDSYSEN